MKNDVILVDSNKGHPGTLFYDIVNRHSSIYYIEILNLKKYF